jgi:hypothetical protein
MKREGRATWLLLGLALTLFLACSRQPGLLSSPQSTQTSPLPFDNPSHSDGISPTQAFASTSIPAGTEIVIRLQSSLSSAESQAGDQFQAVLDGPILVQGQTLVPIGAAITGRVLVAKASGPRERGYMRLTLSSLVLGDKAVDVHTSSLFSKGGPSRITKGSAAANDVQFSTGHRLTFRLIQPLPLPG